MKEKRKEHSRRRLFWLLGAMVFVLGGYISLPYAQTAFVAWWEDDPLTPRCNIPEYGLVANYQDSNSNTIYPLRPNAEPEAFFYLNWGISPNGRWFFDGFNETRQLQFRDRQTNQIIYQFNTLEQWDFAWLYDNRLLHTDMTRRQSQIYNPEQNSLEVLAQSHHVEDVFLHSHQPLVNNYYFLATEIIYEDSAGRSELVAYDMQRNRRIFHRVDNRPWESAYFMGAVSPDGRYFAYQVWVREDERLILSDIWLLDLETGINTKVLSEMPDSTSHFIWSPDSTYFASYFPYDTAALSIVDIQGGVVDYTSAHDRVEVLAWNQDGFWVYEANMNRFADNRLSWGSFDGSTIALRTVMEGRIDKGFVIRGSNNAFITEFNDRDEATSYVINPSGEIEHQLSNSMLTYFARLSPDNRYIAYRSGGNELHYVLDLESGHVCRAFELETDSVFYISWYAYPQS